MKKIKGQSTAGTLRFNMLVDEEWLIDLDKFRGQIPGVSPNRSDTIRSLVTWAIENYPKKTPLPKK
jgi:hypothetical protein